MDRAGLIRMIIANMDRVSALVHTNYHQLAQRHGLSLEQFHLLLEVEELAVDFESDREAPTIGILAKNASVAQNTLSERISRLESRGLVNRIPDSRDRRISRICLTEEGRSLLRSIGAQAEHEFLFDSLSGLADDDLTSLHACYEGLLSCMTRPVNSPKTEGK